MKPKTMTEKELLKAEVHPGDLIETPWSAPGEIIQVEIEPASGLVRGYGQTYGVLSPVRDDHHRYLSLRVRRVGVKDDDSPWNLYFMNILTITGPFQGIDAGPDRGF